MCTRLVPSYHHLCLHKLNNIMVVVGRSMCTWGRSAGVQSTATATPPPLPWSSKLSHRTYYHFYHNHLTTWSNILPAHFRPQVTIYIIYWLPHIYQQNIINLWRPVLFLWRNFTENMFLSPYELVSEEKNTHKFIWQWDINREYQCSLPALCLFAIVNTYSSSSQLTGSHYQRIQLCF